METRSSVCRDLKIPLPPTLHMLAHAITNALFLTVVAGFPAHEHVTGHISPNRLLKV